MRDESKRLVLHIVDGVVAAQEDVSEQVVVLLVGNEAKDANGHFFVSRKNVVPRVDRRPGSVACQEVDCGPRFLLAPDQIHALVVLKGLVLRQVVEEGLSVRGSDHDERSACVVNGWSWEFKRKSILAVVAKHDAVPLAQPEEVLDEFYVDQVVRVVHAGFLGRSEVHVRLGAWVRQEEREGPLADSVSHLGVLVDEQFAHDVVSKIQALRVRSEAHAKDSINMVGQASLPMNQEPLEDLHASFTGGVQANFVGDSLAFERGGAVELLQFLLVQDYERAGALRVEVVASASAALFVLNHKPIGPGVVDNDHFLGVRPDVDRAEVLVVHEVKEVHPRSALFQLLLGLRKPRRIRIVLIRPLLPHFELLDVPPEGLLLGRLRVEYQLVQVGPVRVLVLVLAGHVAFVNLSIPKLPSFRMFPLSGKFH